jgi:uncharacterized protein HemX
MNFQQNDIAAQNGSKTSYSNTTSPSFFDNPNLYWYIALILALVVGGGYFYYQKQALGDLTEKKADLQERKAGFEKAIHALEKKKAVLQSKRNILNERWCDPTNYLGFPCKTKRSQLEQLDAKIATFQNDIDNLEVDAKELESELRELLSQIRKSK